MPQRMHTVGRQPRVRRDTPEDRPLRVRGHVTAVPAPEHTAHAALSCVMLRERTAQAARHRHGAGLPAFRAAPVIENRELRRRLSWAARRPRRPRGHPRRPRFEQSAARGYAGQEDQRAYFERKQPTAPTSADLPDVPKIVLILSRFLRFSGHRHVEWLVGGSSARCTRYHQYLAFLPPQDRVGGHWG